MMSRPNTGNDPTLDPETGEPFTHAVFPDDDGEEDPE